MVFIYIYLHIINFTSLRTIVWLNLILFFCSLILNQYVTTYLNIKVALLVFSAGKVDEIKQKPST